MSILDHVVDEADVQVVDRLVSAMANAMNKTVEVGKTTHADLLSAIFTLLLHVLKETRDREPVEIREANAKEVGRVLMELLVEFGPKESVN